MRDVYVQTWAGNAKMPEEVAKMQTYVETGNVYLPLLPGAIHRREKRWFS